MKNYTIEEYIAVRKGILSDLRIWKQMTKEEKERFNAATSETQVNNIAITMRQKYL
jgi:hypothetical protein